MIPPPFNGPEVVNTARNKAELFAKLFSSNSTLDDTGHILPDFPPRTDKVDSSQHNNQNGG